MQYNPGVYDRSGEIIAAGTMQAAQTQADLMRELGEKARQTATAVAGFAAGGPAGAAMASGGGRSGGGGGGGGEGVIGSLINSFANKKALETKDKAYMGFFERHGEDLGFDPEYLTRLKDMNRDERVAAFDLMTGQPGQRLGSLEYLNTQANRFGGGSGTGAGGGGGGGGGSGDYVVGGGWGG
jgi:hypothetical protein